MQHRSLGKTGIQVSEIGFGSGPTAGLMIYGTPEEQASTVKLAYDLGITYFDTAPIYGDFVSEENLGRALQTAVSPRPLLPLPWLRAAIAETELRRESSASR